MVHHHNNKRKSYMKNNPLFDLDCNVGNSHTHYMRGTHAQNSFSRFPCPFCPLSSLSFYRAIVIVSASLYGAVFVIHLGVTRFSFYVDASMINSCAGEWLNPPLMFVWCMRPLLSPWFVSAPAWETTVCSLQTDVEYSHFLLPLIVEFYCVAVTGLLLYSTRKNNPLFLRLSVR